MVMCGVVVSRCISDRCASKSGEVRADAFDVDAADVFSPVTHPHKKQMQPLLMCLLQVEVLFMVQLRILRKFNRTIVVCVKSDSE